MAITVQSIIDDAAARLSDPRKGRIAQARWLALYNDATEEISLGWKVLEQYASHNLTALEDRYTYPDDCVQMTRWRWSATPSDATTFLDGKEWFEDEMRNAQDWGALIGVGPTYRYRAHANFFELYPKPDVLVVDGGLIVYWKLAAAVIDATLAAELPATMRMFVRDLMLVGAKRELQRNDEWPGDLAVWEQRMNKVYDRIEDRSEDRREAFRPATLKRGFRGMN